VFIFQDMFSGGKSFEELNAEDKKKWVILQDQLALCQRSRSG